MTTGQPVAPTTPVTPVIPNLPDYSGMLAKLSPKDKSDYINSWQTYLSKIPTGGYSATITQMTRKYGPQFVSQIIEPQPQDTSTLATTSPTAPVTPPPSTTPWYKSNPLIKDASKVVGTLYNPIYQGLQAENRAWITPAAETVLSPLSAQLRANLGNKNPFQVPQAQRQQALQNSNIPWLGKFAAQTAVDPLTYFGWGIPDTIASKVPELASLMAPLSVTEEGFQKVAELPLKGVSSAIRATPVGDWLLSASKKAVVNQMPTATADLLNNLTEAGKQLAVPKTIDQILDDISTGSLDKELADTITSTPQKSALDTMIRHADELNADSTFEAAKNASLTEPTKAANYIGTKVRNLTAKDLGLAPDILGNATIAQTKKVIGNVNALWKQMVLMTPWYIIQQFSETTLRELMVGANPFTSIDMLTARPDFNLAPVEIQNKAINFNEGVLHPETMQDTLLDRASAGGTVGEATTGRLPKSGIENIPSNITQWWDKNAVARTYFSQYDDNVKTLLKNASPETQQAINNITKLGEALKAQVDNVGRPLLEPKVVDELVHSAISGQSTENFVKTVQNFLGNPSLEAALPMTDAENTVPMVVRSQLKRDITSAFTKGDSGAISDAFDKAIDNLPKRMSDIQQQSMLRQLKEFENQVLAGFGDKSTANYIRRTLASYAKDAATDSASELAALKGYGSYQDTMFNINVNSRRSTEQLADTYAVSNLLMNNASPNEIVTYMTGSNGLTKNCYNASDAFRAKTIKLSDLIAHSRNAGNIANAWTDFIKEAQSMVPEATSLANISANTDDMWDIYRQVQNKRWWQLGQSKMELAGITPGTFLSTIDPTSGKMLTADGIIAEQTKVLRDWQTRAEQSFEDAHTSNIIKSTKEATQEFQENVVKELEPISLQKTRLSNQAKDMALQSVRDTFGHYSIHTNLDELMTKVAPFWYFPSRSIPFYAQQVLDHPQMAIDLYNIHNQQETSNQPSSMFGYIKIPNTNLYYSPMRVSYLWRLATQGNYTPQDMGSVEGAQSLLQKIGVSLGPQFSIAEAIIKRVMGTKAGSIPQVTQEPTTIIPQQQWLQAVANLDLPGISQIAGVVNAPFDVFLRGVYGDDTADYQKRQVELFMVDKGINPASATTEQIQSAWKQYYSTVLASIPAGTVKPFTATEQARLNAINAKVQKMGLTPEQQNLYKQAGESPLVGMRQDQIDAFYSDIPGEKLMSYVRPAGLTPETEPYWNDYVNYHLQQQEALQTRESTETQLDNDLTAGVITPSAWKEGYKQSYASYTGSIDSFQEAYPKAMITSAQWDAFKKLTGSNINPKNPDDIALENYYNTMDASNTQWDDPNTGIFNASAYQAAQTKFLNQYPEETQKYILSQKDKNMSPLRLAYTQDMATVQPYYNLQTMVESKFPAEVSTILNYALKTSDTATQNAILSANPQALLCYHQINLAKTQYLIQNPTVSQILRYWNS